MRLHAFEPDPDPYPRAVAVGPGSAYAPIPRAVVVQPDAIEELEPPAVAPRETRQLGTWRFAPGDRRPAPESDAWRLVAVPHVWSRAEPELADHKGPCWYARELDLDPARHHQVRFGALDYVADVYVDGTAVTSHEGGFTPVAVELPASTTRADVALRVDDPPEEGLLGPHPLTAAKRKVKGVQEFHDSRPGGFAGGVWWQDTAALRWGTGGIVDDVVVISSGEIRIDAVFATAAGDRLALNWVVTNLGSSPASIELRSSIRAEDTPPTGLGVRASVPTGSSRVAVHGRAEGMVAWSPRQPSLHELATEVRVAGEVSDTHRIRFGARRVDMRVDGEDRYRLHLDGRRTYVRAVNYIPCVWWPELTEETFRRDLELAAAAHVNGLGPHALVLPDRFYDLADDAGMLVHQDMPLNLGHDPAGPPLFRGGPTMAEASVVLAAELTYRLYNHPSIVYWCGHNEPAYQLAEVFAGADHPDLVAIRERLEGMPDEEALDRRRQRQWEHIDPTRPAWMASGLGRHRDGGDVHTYSGSLSTDPATAIAEVSAAFVSEFGAWTTNFSGASVPGAAGDWPPAADTAATWERLGHIWWSSALHAGRPDRYPDHPTATFGAQLFAGAFLKVATEGFRRRKWDPTGAHRWHLWADHWGDAGAGVVDRHRAPQLQYWALAAANRPLLPVIEFPRSMRAEPGDVSLRTWVVNDHHDLQGPHQLQWEVARLAADERYLLGADDPQVTSAFGVPEPTSGDLVVLPRARGETVADGRATVDVGADASTPGPVITVRLEDPRPTAYAVWLTLDGPDGRVDNWGSFVVAPDSWDPSPGLSPFPRFDLTVRCRGRYRVVRRWTGATVASGADSGSHLLPPDQYVVRSGSDHQAVSLFGASTVDLVAGTTEAEDRLPWPFDPGLCP